MALGTPAGLAERQGGGNHMRFRPSKPFDDRVLTGLAEVDRVEREGPRVAVSGTGELFNAVVRALAAAGVDALEVQLDSATLEDAFLRLVQPSWNSREEVTTP
jgi:ABC-2 type transport system ATP-binding protein